MTFGELYKKDNELIEVRAEFAGELVQKLLNEKSRPQVIRKPFSMKAPLAVAASLVLLIGAVFLLPVLFMNNYLNDAGASPEATFGEASPMTVTSFYDMEDNDEADYGLQERNESVTIINSGASEILAVRYVGEDYITNFVILSGDEQYYLYERIINYSGDVAGASYIEIQTDMYNIHVYEGELFDELFALIEGYNG
ncbi:MAG: hypothetical protein FWD34_06130 [Oscillospiraceae bacterium]|nr:hypothetical protein [Oscillospiraceae bacterium]